MKKTVFIGLLVILLAFGFISCDNNDGNGSNVHENGNNNLPAFELNGVQVVIPDNEYTNSKATADFEYLFNGEEGSRGDALSALIENPTVKMINGKLNISFDKPKNWNSKSDKIFLMELVFVGESNGEDVGLGYGRYGIHSGPDGGSVSLIYTEKEGSLAISDFSDNPLINTMSEMFQTVNLNINVKPGWNYLTAVYDSFNEVNVSSSVPGSDFKWLYYEFDEPDEPAAPSPLPSDWKNLDYSEWENWLSGLDMNTITGLVKQTLMSFIENNFNKLTEGGQTFWDEIGLNPFVGTWSGVITDEDVTGNFTIMFEETTFETIFEVTNNPYYDPGELILKQKGSYTYSVTDFTITVSAIDWIVEDESQTGGWTSSGEYFDVYGGDGQFTGTLLTNEKIIFVYNLMNGELTKIK